MGQSFGMEAEEASVVRYQNASGGGGERELRRIVSADQARLEGFFRRDSSTRARSARISSRISSMWWK